MKQTMYLGLDELLKFYVSGVLDLTKEEFVEVLVEKLDHIEQDRCDKSWEEGYDEGFRVGHDAGYKDGYDDCRYEHERDDG
jgi:flagellar biosynthesis/type III secretory pathway protein FliH